jgi:hypothetical protein
MTPLSDDVPSYEAPPGASKLKTGLGLTLGMGGAILGYRARGRPPRSVHAHAREIEISRF